MYRTKINIEFYIPNMLSFLYRFKFHMHIRFDLKLNIDDIAIRNIHI